MVGAVEEEAPNVKIVAIDNLLMRVERQNWDFVKITTDEGITGVGTIGSFDRAAKKFAFLQTPEVVDWSVSNLLVEGDTIWAGLVRHPEGADRSGGLLRRDNKSGRSRTYAVDDVIFRIERWRDGLYLTTSNGIYVLTGERITRHRVEPDINAKPSLVSEQL